MNKSSTFASHIAESDQPTLAGRTPIGPGTIDILRRVEDVNLSADGQRVAFVVWEYVPEQPKRRARVWVVETVAGAEPRPVSKGPCEDTNPRWSPDGQQLAFISVQEGDKGKPQLYVLPAAGGEAKQVCMMPNGVSDMEWSPDGSRIAFVSLEGEEPGKDPLVIGPERARRLWTVRAGHDVPEPVTPAGVTVWEYAWSADSRQLALYYSTGSDKTDWYRGQIGVLPANGGALRQVTQLTRQASGLAWSPDGTRLAYISGEWSDPCRGAGDLFVVPVEGGEAHNLTPGADLSLSWCHWFPDGQRLLYTAWSGVTQQIGILNEGDGTLETLAGDFVMNSHWPALSTTPDLRAFATVHTDQQYPDDAWLGELSGAERSGGSIAWRRLSRLNPIPEETWAQVPSERISYESEDGWRIDALFTPPLNYKGAGPPPLIAFVHGGPSWAYTDDFASFWTQVLASAGYAVLRPNIRGSWGRGVAFADAVVGDMGGKDFQDVLRGVDYLVERGLVDGERVGIAGWSYGGFMAAWAITQTTRFKAAIMGAGVSDFHSFHAQSDIPDWDVRFLGAPMLEQPEVYRKRSAITYAGHATTPTLILHGENDECVPVNQAYAFYRALRERAVPVEMVVYPREGHGPRERDHLRDMDERVLRWLEQYL
ncbi:MAG: S9 family peptidase [Chloroflexota bacterium]|nr:S9 family peptidase [Chloroflexota bacterium]